MSGPDPRISQAVNAHSMIIAALSVVHSLRTQGLRRTLLFAVLGNAIPILGELVTINVLKVLRHHVRPQVGVVPLAIALLWYNVGYGTIATMISTINAPDTHKGRESPALAPATTPPPCRWRLPGSLGTRPRCCPSLAPRRSRTWRRMWLPPCESSPTRRSQR